MIRHTEKGQLYLDRPASEQRHLDRVFEPLEQVEKKYGVGTRLYFTFLKWITLCNAALAIPGIVSWALFLSDRAAASSTTAFTWGDFFTSAYLRPQSDRYWFACSLVAFISWWFVGPLYYLWERHYTAPRSRRVMTRDEQIIRENVEKRPDYIFSICATLAYLAVSAVFLYGLIQAQNYVINRYISAEIAPGIGAGTAMTLVVALGFAICHMSWGHVSYYVTRTENNPTWFKFRMSQAIKLIAFKLALPTIMYVLLVFVVETSSEGGCNLEFVGINFFLVLVVDVVLTFALQTLWPVLKRVLYKHCRAESTLEGPEFNIAEDLLQLMFRQFIIYIGFFAFPLMGLLGFLACVAEYAVDRYRLARVCRDPYYLPEKPGLFLLIFIQVAVGAAFITYPNGALWMLFLPNLLPPSLQNCSVTGAIHRL